MTSKSDIISKAISAGAPLYNAGKADQCHSAYVAAGRILLETAVTTPAEAAALRQAIELSNQQNSKDQAAWTMRRAFDGILDGSIDAAVQFELSLPEGASEYTVLDFGTSVPDVPRWRILDDNIMGGSSSSGLIHDLQEGAAVFTGTVITAGGGFASVRSQGWSGWNLAPARGIRLRVKGDGRVYKLNAKTDDATDGVVYQHDFQTSGTDWQDISLPFESFRPNFRGQLIQGQPRLTGARVRQIGFMLSKFSDAGGLVPGFRQGQFKLAVRRVCGFR